VEMTRGGVDGRQEIDREGDAKADKNSRRQGARSF
jgi:hypothetical protein